MHKFFVSFEELSEEAQLYRISGKRSKSLLKKAAKSQYASVRMVPVASEKTPVKILVDMLKAEENKFIKEKIVKRLEKDCEISSFPTEVWMNSLEYLSRKSMILLIGSPNTSEEQRTTMLYKTKDPEIVKKILDIFWPNEETLRVLSKSPIAEIRLIIAKYKNTTHEILMSMLMDAMEHEDEDLFCAITENEKFEPDDDDLITISKNEYWRARKWAAEKLVSSEDLLDMLEEENDVVVIKAIKQNDNLFGEAAFSAELLELFQDFDFESVGEVEFYQFIATYTKTIFEHFKI